MATLLLKNCHLISPDVDLPNAAVLIEGEKVKRIFAPGDALPAADSVMDMEGDMVMPGFVDVHCHGRSGEDFCDATDNAITTMAVDKLKEGVTTLLPTTLTLAEDTLATALQTAANYVKSGVKGCKVPGVHLEGPFINPKCLGAQNPDFVRKPDIEEVKRLNSVFPVSKVSFAIEMDGAPEFAAELLSEGITPSCVHSAATFKQFQEGKDHGLVNLSHFCNQMTALHHRDIGLVGAGFFYDEVYIEFICDTLHICPDMISLVFQLKDIDHIQLITDAMRAAGMPEGEYTLGGLPVIVKDGAARLASNGALAGSTLQLCDALKNVYEITGMDLDVLVRTTSWNQARALGFDGIGKIEPGYFADIVVLNDEFKVKKTFVNGELRYSA